MKRPRKLLRLLLWGLLTLTLLGGTATVILYLQIAPTLPSTDTLKDVRMQVPLRVYAHGNELIGEYGEMKRTPLAYKDIPDLMIKAVLAAEDDRFFEHPGVDYQGLLRAAVHLLRTGEKGQGGSTITMQVARNFFLTPEKTYTRKLTEILLALKIDRELSKEEILELYLNKIFLGQRAYGVAVAAQTYYGKDIHGLTLAQYAMLAGLPKAPSTMNPVSNPSAALNRRNYVLGRMLSLGYISQEQYDVAAASGVTASLHVMTPDAEAPYVAEMARAWMVERYSNDAYTAGYKVYTTIDTRLQTAANKALRDALLAYDQRHGYRGAEAHIDLAKNASFDAWDQALSGYGSIGSLRPALVVAIEEQAAIAYHPAVGMVLIDWPGLAWARSYVDENTLGPEPTRAADILKVGDIIRIQLHADCSWYLSQVPNAGAALVALRPQDGALQALSGGFDFFHSKFNRALQAERQPGSSFKPFIYAAALDKGFTPATVVNDAPVVFEDAELESAWRPENYSGRFYGPTRLRVALTNSRNLVSIRVLRSIGISYTLEYLEHFGFNRSKLPRDLSLSLGSGSLTPMEMTRGYAVFANGGFLVEPHFIERVEDAAGNIVYQAEPPRACSECETTAPADAPGETPAETPTQEPPAPSDTPAGLAPRVLDARTVYISTSMMQDVIRYGTGRQALALGRKDLAGKTGTTNEQRDAWFTGYNQALAVTAWVGFDTPRPLGNQETGARAALPMWVDFMAEALRDVPQLPLQQPAGLVTARIDAETGEFTSGANPNAIFEVFRSEDVVTEPAPATANGTPAGEETGNLSEQLF
ncbi:MAG: penicillin-binding protein 1A [Pseudomonadota bacterium]